MKRLIPFLLMPAVLAAMVARAQLPMQAPPHGTQGGAASFTGIGDAVSGAKLHIGLIAYSSANKTPNLINLCDNAGAHCGDVAAVNGIVSSTQVVNGNTCTNHSGAHPCLIHTFYDDSGANNCSAAACNMVQTLSTSMPFFEPNCKGTVPCFYCDTGAGNSSQTAATWGGFGGAGVGFTLIAAVTPTVTEVANSRVLASLNGAFIGINSSNDAFLYAGSFSTGTALTNGTFVSEIGVSDTSNNGIIYVNGSGNTSTSVGTNASGNTVGVCGDPGAGGNINAQQMEDAIYTSALTSGNVSSIVTKMRANGGY